MDVDLNFWKYQKGVYLDNQQVYVTACCEGEEIEGLELLPISEIMEKLKTTFSSWDFVAPDVFDGKNIYAGLTAINVTLEVDSDKKGISKKTRNDA